MSSLWPELTALHLWPKLDWFAESRERWPSALAYETEAGEDRAVLAGVDVRSETWILSEVLHSQALNGLFQLGNFDIRAVDAEEGVLRPIQSFERRFRNSSTVSVDPALARSLTEDAFLSIGPGRLLFYDLVTHQTCGRHIKHKSWKAMMDLGRDPREALFFL